MLNRFFTLLIFYSVAGKFLAAAPDRITRPIDPARTVVLAGNVHRLAAPQFDRGALDPQTQLHYMLLLTKPSASQQADLDQLLLDQQNPSSPQFHKWLSPEEFAGRFGLSPADHAKIADWLKSQGLSVDKLARGRNWVAFSGTADQVSKALHTTIHSFQINGQSHFANSTEPSVPAALADVTAGFLGLNDFKPKSNVVRGPNYTSGGNHYLAPADYSTIYNIAPLYQASGLDGTGAGIAIVGESDVLLTDLQAFKKQFGLPTNNPKMVNYDGVDPGYNDAEFEANLDLEWSSAIAPQATIYYVYGADAFTAMVVAIESNYAPIVSVSWSSCELDVSLAPYRAIAQQGNAQGITIVAASGDSGAAACDDQGLLPFAEGGQAVNFPAVLPEVTGIGGTQFVEGTGTYWSSTNSATFGSALSYIPEAAWNETNSSGLGSTGGGASIFLGRPAWQTGLGVPADNARHVPDLALSSAGHDYYLVYYAGATYGAAGTSASTPSMAGILALLNQFQVKTGHQAKVGLGNINPQLYRLAQTSPFVFHDILAGSNVVPCGQGSPGCTTGSFGYKTGLGYDMATGLGSVDANNFVGQWNAVTNAVTVSVTANAAKVTSNDSLQLTASVVPVTGAGIPTGTVSFETNGIPLGSASLAANGMATITFPTYLIGIGTYALFATYSGDTAFSSAGASARVQITAPTGVASIIPSAPNTVLPNLPDAQGLSWQTTLTLNEVAGVAAMLTGFTIDGQPQTVAIYFPETNITPKGSISSTFLLRNQATPLTHIYGFTGVDIAGNTWSRQVSVIYNSPFPYEYDITFSATPQVVAQDTTADPSCQWPVHLHLDNLGGYLNSITTLQSGYHFIQVPSQIDAVFGTTRVDAYASLAGTLCFGGITPPATQSIAFFTAQGVFNELNISFTGPPASPVKIAANPANITQTSQAPQATLSLSISNRTEPWTASVYPANRTTQWLTVSQLSGTGVGTLSLTANGAGFEPGVYRANIVLQCIDAVPQSVTIPVMFVLGGSTQGTVINGVGNAATFQNTAAPGMLLTVVGANLANSTAVPPGTSPLPYSTAGVSATVNGIGAPLVYVSPTQVNLQIPYTAGAGPAVVGINNNGQIAGFQFNIAPAAPGIFGDSSGNLVPQPTVAAGAIAVLYFTGAGEVPALSTAFWPAATTAASALPQPALPISVAVGGLPAFLQFYGQISGALGATQVNFTVPASLTPGTYPVIVTVGGVASPPVMLTVTAAAAKQ